jgi:hypothetical protein
MLWDRHCHGVCGEKSLRPGCGCQEANIRQTLFDNDGLGVKCATTLVSTRSAGSNQFVVLPFSAKAAILGYHDSTFPPEGPLPRLVAEGTRRERPPIMVG